MTLSISTKTSGGTSSTPSLSGSAKLRIDFFESGDGETIVVEFPDGGIGIIDAHPSNANSRPSILNIIGARPIHFVCLTHPHADHGIDLIPILKQQKVKVPEFWHTNPDVSSFIFHCATERSNYASPVRDFVNQLADGWADFLLDIFSSLDGIPDRTLHSGVKPITIAGVRIHFLGPDEQVAKRFVAVYKARASKPGKALPNPNFLSAILALEYNGTLILLGADALKRNWNDAITVHAREKLPRAALLKVPHHGASNALALERGRKNYLDLCAKRNCVAVLFAGDSKHPEPRVFAGLKSATQVTCLANGLKGAHGPKNPLGIRIPGAQQVRRSFVCKPQITAEIDSSGALTVVSGHACPFCA